MGLVIFLSHCMEDTEKMLIPNIAEKLKNKEGIDEVIYCEKDCWNNIVDFMDESLKRTDVLVLFCSPNALKSEWVKKEWTAALSSQIPIIPVFAKLDHIPTILRPEKGVPFDIFDEDEMVDELYELIQNKPKKSKPVSGKKEPTIIPEKSGASLGDTGTLDISILESIAEFGDPNIPFGKIDTSPLLKRDIDSAKALVDQITQFPVSKRKSIGTKVMWRQAGRVFGKLKEPSYAEICFRMAILLDPNYAMAWVFLGYVVSDPKEKEKCYRKAIELNPNYAEAWYNLGTVVSNPKEQENCYRKAIELDPKLAVAWYNLGTVVSDPKEQEKCFRKAIEIDPNYAKAWYYLGYLLNNEEYKKKARDLGYKP